jgi:lysosomal-associated transmembrane protein
LPTPLPRRRFSNDNVEENAKMQKSFYTKNEMMFFTQKRIQSGDAHLALALILGLFSITAMLIYGAAKSRPVYLLPFFCFQVFDFVLACLTALGHYTWLPNLREIIENNPDFPFRDQLLQMNAQWIALFISLMYVVVLMVKAYFIGVVWACYQYLHAKNAGIFSYRDDGDGIQRDAELLLPPDYENASKFPPVYQGPPPPYYHA